MVEVHLHSVFADFEYDTWNHSSSAVQHWYGGAGYEQVLPDLAVYLECALGKVYDLVLIDFSLPVCR